MSKNSRRVDSKIGFHRLKDVLKQKSYLESHCIDLVKDGIFDSLLKITQEDSPKRSGKQKSYRLTRGVTQEISLTKRESLWERAALVKFGRAGKQSEVSDCWDRLIAFQVPLFASEQKNGWGYVDLLGYSNDGTISIIELKKESTGQSPETPLRIVLEALAYAIALKTDWVGFRKQLVKHLEALDISKAEIDKIPRNTNKVKIRLVGVAPASYWLDWIPVSSKGVHGLDVNTWRAFSKFLSKLRDNKFPVSFASLSGSPEMPETLSAQTLTHFPDGLANWE